MWDSRLMKAKQGEPAGGLLTPACARKDSGGLSEHLNKGTNVGNCEEIKGRTRLSSAVTSNGKHTEEPLETRAGYRSLHTRSISTARADGSAVVSRDESPSPWETAGEDQLGRLWSCVSTG